tara:strand:- start:43 stop:522 length:480 start_codon:yes stop_codon:yes gene_type:complete
MKHIKHIGQDVLSKFKYDEVNGGVIRVKWIDRDKSAPKPTNKGYILYGVTTNSSQLMYPAHRLTYLLHNPDMDQHLTIDHINGIKTDNRIENLRAISNQQNNFNRHTNKGFSWVPALKKFRADIGVDYKVVYLGLYDTILDARAAYLRAKRKYHVIEEG